MSAVIDEVDVVYPESDGKPMADNTLQWDWIVRIVSELKELFAGQQAFVAGDLFWYPVQGNPRLVTAPDALVVVGRPPGNRGSYKQWEEANIAPQVVFEVLSPSNTPDEMQAKFVFYETYGVEEYYVIDADAPSAQGYVRVGSSLVPITPFNGHVSPRLGIRFETTPDDLRIFTPGGRPFQDRTERVREVEEELRRTGEAFEQQRSRMIEAERARDVYLAKLRELGIDPESLGS